MENDEPIASAVLDVALAATQILTVAEALTLQYGAEVVRNGLLVACVTLAERDLGHAGMVAELNDKMAILTESPMVEAAVHKWLH